MIIETSGPLQHPPFLYARINLSPNQKLPSHHPPHVVLCPRGSMGPVGAPVLWRDWRAAIAACGVRRR
jgi:hypothetical protein